MAEKEDGCKTIDAYLARLWQFVGTNHDHVEEHTGKLQDFEDTRLAEKISQANSKIIQGCGARLAKDVVRREIIEAAAETAREAVEERDEFTASIEVRTRRRKRRRKLYAGLETAGAGMGGLPDLAKVLVDTQHFLGAATAK